jgi:tripartite-type tricarboxylate transporter receptor subunit TctC
MIRIMIFAFVLTLISNTSYSQIYSGKTIEFVISNAVGGGFDLYGRTFSRYYSEHIPGNPDIVIRNISGASGMTGIKYTLEKKVTDGTHINLVQPSPFLWSAAGIVDFDASSIEWIGSLNRDIWLIIADSEKVRSWKDITNSDVFVGTTSPLDDGSITVRLLSYVLKKNINLVSGYKNNPEVLLGLERGEIFVASGHTYSTTANKKPDWITGNSRYRVVLVETTFTSQKLLPNIPTILSVTENKDFIELIKFVSARYDLGRPIWTLPGTNETQLKILRTAFKNTINDPRYKEELRKRELGDEPDDSEYLKQVVEKMYSTSKTIKDIAASVIENK